MEPRDGATRQPGCDNCFASNWRSAQGMGIPRTCLMPAGDEAAGFRRRDAHDALGLPLSWRKPRVVFDELDVRIFNPKVSGSSSPCLRVMASARAHVPVLTKRRGGWSR